MAELTRPQIKEAAATAVVGVKERTGALARGQKEEAAQHEFFEGLRRRSEEKGHRDVLEKWGEGKIDEAKIEEDIQERVGGRNIIKTAKRSGETGASGKKAKERIADVQEFEVLIRSLLETPLVEVPEGSLEQRILIEAGKIGLEGFPGGKFLLDAYATDPDGLDLLIWDGLKNLDETGEVRASILKRYQEVHGEERRVSEKEQAAQTKAEAARQQVEQNRTATERNVSDLTAAQEELDSFDPGKPNGKKLREVTKKYNNFIDTEIMPHAAGFTRADIEAIFKNKGTLNERIRNTGERLAGIAAGDPRRPALESRHQDLLEEEHLVLTYGAGYDAVATPKNALEAQKAEAKTRTRDLAMEGDGLRNKKDALVSAFHAARADVEGARLEASDEYVKDSQNVLTDAITGLYRERYKTALASEAKVIERAIEAETDPAAKAIMEQIRDGRWRRIDVGKKVISKIPGVRHGKNLGHGEIERFDRGRIRTDIFLLKQEDGDRKVAMEMLKQLKDSAGNPLYGTWDASGKNIVYSAADMEKINDILSSDKFKNEIIPFIRTDLVARAIQTGDLSVKDTEFIKKIYGDAAYNDAEAKHAKFIEGEKKRLGFVGKTKDFVKAHPQLTTAILLTFAAPQLMTLGWMGYGAYKLFPRKEHGEKGKSGAPRRMTDAEQEDEEKKRKREPINFEDEAKKKAADAKKAADEARKAAEEARRAEEEAARSTGS